MNRRPECLVLIDPNKEKNAILEARSLGITTIALIDSNCDPDMVDLPIPGNDDGIRSVELIMSHLADAVIAGKKNIVAKNEGKDRTGRKNRPKSKPKAKKAPAAAPAAKAEAAPAKAEAAPAAEAKPEAAAKPEATAAKEG